MPYQHQLCKAFHTHRESQNKLKVIFGQFLFNAKATCGNTRGEFVSHSELPGSSRKFAEVAGPGRPLSIPEAASRTLATQLVNGRVCNSCYCTPCQVLLEKNQHYTSKKKLCSTLTSLRHGTLNAPSLMHAPRFHVCLLDPPPGPSSLLAAPLFNCEGHHDRSGSSEKSVLSSVCTRDCSQRLWWPHFLRCRADESGNRNEILYEAQQNKELLTDWPVSTAIAFHLMQLGQSLFPAGLKSSKALKDSLGGVASSIAVRPSVVRDCATDKCSSELAEKHNEGSLSSSGLRLLSGACCLPHPEKQDTGGEDAYFICPDKQIIGVADGVGGWADVGIDAGEYARQLMNQSLIAAQQEPAGCIDTARVMEIAHSRTTCRGSSTACILALSNDCLQAANLGDSGFLVVRNGRLVFKSPPQQHNFNVPFQLENGGGDPPDAAQVFTVEVAAGDVVVAGTDGLFDNLYEKDIVGLVVQASRVGSGPDITAKKIASLARERAQDCNRQTPFSAAAQDAGFRFYGGKMDDITVIASYVVK